MSPFSLTHSHTHFLILSTANSLPLFIILIWYFQSSLLSFRYFVLLSSLSLSLSLSMSLSLSLSLSINLISNLVYLIDFLCSDPILASLFFLPTLSLSHTHPLSLLFSLSLSIYLIILKSKFVIFD